jgi:hypothetical protein
MPDPEEPLPEDEMRALLVAHEQEERAAEDAQMAVREQLRQQKLEAELAGIAAKGLA